MAIMLPLEYLQKLAGFDAYRNRQIFGGMKSGPISVVSKLAERLNDLFHRYLRLQPYQTYINSLPLALCSASGLNFPFPII